MIEALVFIFILLCLLSAIGSHLEKDPMFYQILIIIVPLVVLYYGIVSDFIQKKWIRKTVNIIVGLIIPLYVVFYYPIRSHNEKTREIIEKNTRYGNDIADLLLDTGCSELLYESDSIRARGGIIDDNIKGPIFDKYEFGMSAMKAITLAEEDGVEVGVENLETGSQIPLINEAERLYGVSFCFHSQFDLPKDSVTYDLLNDFKKVLDSKLGKRYVERHKERYDLCAWANNGKVTALYAKKQKYDHDTKEYLRVFLIIYQPKYLKERYDQLHPYWSRPEYLKEKAKEDSMAKAKNDSIKKELEKKREDEERQREQKKRDNLINNL